MLSEALGPGTLVPHPCQLGRLQCVWFVIAEEYCDILAVFFTSFVLFVWALRPASLDEDDDEEGRGPTSSDEDEDDEGRVPKRRVRAPVAEARMGTRTTSLSERPDNLPVQRRRATSGLASQGSRSGLRPGSPTAQAQSANTRKSGSSRRATALDAAGVNPAASRHAIAPAQRYEAPFSPISEVHAAASRERSESWLQSHSSSGSEPKKTQRSFSTLRAAEGQDHDSVLVEARLRHRPPEHQLRQRKKVQSAISSGSNFYAYLVLKRAAK